MIAVWLFLTISRVCLQFVIVVFPDHTHLLFLGLGILRLTQPIGQGTEGGSPAGQAWPKSRGPTCWMPTR